MTSPVKFAANLLSGPTARKGYTTTLDQTVVSGASFITKLAVARLGAETFGAFTLTYGLLMFANGVQTAAITGPLGVIAPKLNGAGASTYLRASLRLQVLFVLAFAALVALSGLALGALGHGGIRVLLLTLAPAIIAWQLQEFMRRVMFTEGRAAAVALNDAVSYGIQVIGVLWLLQAGQLTPLAAFWLITLGQGLGVILGAWQTRSSFRSPPGEPAAPTTVRLAVNRNWFMARWSLAANLVQWASEQINPYLMALLASLALSGTYNALMNIIGIAWMLSFAAESILGPRAARALASGGRPALDKFIHFTYLVLTPPVIAFLLVIAVFGGPIMGLLYHHQYDAFRPQLSFLAVSAMFFFVHKPIAIGLRALEHARPTFVAYSWSTVYTLTVNLYIIHRFGLWGALFGGLVQSIILTVVLVQAWRSTRRAWQPHWTAPTQGDAA